MSAERCSIRSRRLRLACRKTKDHTRDHRCGPLGWANWSQPVPGSSHSGMRHYPTESEALRWHAIRCALYYGLVPSRFYEDTPHYAPIGYWAHLRMNLAYAWRWWTGQQTEADLQFERETNTSLSPQQEGGADG